MDTQYVVPVKLSRPRSYDEAVAEVERELGVRRRCYDRWVNDGKLDSITAAERYERMAAALKFMVNPENV